MKKKGKRLIGCFGVKWSGNEGTSKKVKEKEDEDNKFQNKSSLKTQNKEGKKKFIANLINIQGLTKQKLAESEEMFDAHCDMLFVTETHQKCD